MIRLTGTRLYGLSTSAVTDFSGSISTGFDAITTLPIPAVRIKFRLEYFIRV
jgi:hypothetical protein